MSHFFKMVGIISDHGRLGEKDSQKGAHFVQVRFGTDFLDD